MNEQQFCFETIDDEMISKTIDSIGPTAKNKLWI